MDAVVIGFFISVLEKHVEIAPTAKIDHGAPQPFLTICPTCAYPSEQRGATQSRRLWPRHLPQVVAHKLGTPSSVSFADSYSPPSQLFCVVFYFFFEPPLRR
jgi:hypothetical protein